MDRFHGQNDEWSILSDIEQELKPIINFLEFRFLDDELKNVGLKQEISNKEFTEQTKITRKELIKLLDWFNDNIKATEEVYKAVVGSKEQEHKNGRKQ